MEESILQIIKSTFKDAADITFREIIIPKGKITLIFVRDIIEKHLIGEYIIRPLLKHGKTIETLQGIMDHVLLTSANEKLDELEVILGKLLSGNVIITCDFDHGAIGCETTKFSTRNIPKPDTDPAIKGPQEGFNESLQDNLSLIRKRIQNRYLAIKLFKVGSSSQTSVAVIYLKETAPEKLINEITDKVQNLKTNFILETNYIEEEFKYKYTLFDTVGNFDKPDIVCSMLFEGRVAIMVEGSPSVAILPYFFTENFISPDDYYTNHIFASGLRILRYFSFLVSVLAPAFYVALTTYHHSLIPSVFLFKLASARAGVPFPSILETLLMLLFLELAREAGRRLPKSIGATLTLVSTLILGETAVSAGMASGGTIVVVGVYAVTSLINPKLISPIITLTILATILSSIFGLHGFFIFFIMMIAHIASLECCGYPYLFPLGTSKRINYKSRDFLFRGKAKDISYNILKGTEEE